MPTKRVHEIWPVQEPTAVRSAGGGNNSNQVVETPSGTYLLRVYVNHRDPIRLHYELSVLTALQERDLPFRVPAPIPTREGQPYVTLPDGLATLTPFLPGQPPERGNVQHMHAGGVALGHLIQGLSGLPPLPKEGQIPPYGDLPGIHPMVPDPLASLSVVPVGAASQRRLARLYEALMREAPALYTTLPCQQVHSDYVRGNVLMVEGHVRGVIDFEFTTMDLRAMDLATGLEAWTGLAWDGLPDWEMLHAFGQGYVSSQPLLPEEAEALPLLLRLRRVTTLIHYTGRFLQGLETEQGLKELADWILQLDEWLEEHGTAVVKGAREWQGY